MNTRTATPTAAPGKAASYRWLPVRSLAQRHRPRILSHLLSLDPADRYLRFGYAASDSQVGRYVDGIDFVHDEVFGVFNRRLELVALAHLAYLSPVPGQPPAAEFGVSVVGGARGRGFGARLFEHAVLHARNRGITTLVIHALSENTAMLKIARNAGAVVERSGSEAEARLKLPPEDLVSNVEQLLGDQAAEIDYRLKVHARQVNALLEGISSVKSYFGVTGRGASE
ncbi:MAG: GNAT family N-acetyltransferase [Aquincola tertiaricarbonis]|uniref:GNAT family N-acetyltransferase n=1 Tax=Aquincola tertiaricarbonis TaxID=391953 RepID=UPI000614A428|nr:GNAT family N-acetyltransferase [Aquincola tertiaricarbonis]